MKTSLLTTAIGIWMLFAARPAAGWQDHAHGTAKPATEIRAPRIFLDKSRRIVDFQLNRLDNQRLLMVERGDDDSKYLPVHEAILKREGIPTSDRETALLAIAKINQSTPAAELLSLIAQLDQNVPGNPRVTRQLADLLLQRPGEELRAQVSELAELTESSISSLQKTGFAGLIVVGANEQIEAELESDGNHVALIESIPWVPDQQQRNTFHARLIAWLDGNKKQQNAALKALRSLSVEPAATFTRVAKLATAPNTRQQSIKTLLSIEPRFWSEQAAQSLAENLIEFAEVTPPAERTSDSFLEAMQVADQAFSVIEPDRARRLRTKLDQFIVRVILIHTVEEEMRYDKPWFAVQAGKDVQVILRNDDLMPHNLVITAPGKLKDVALAGAALGPQLGASGKQYVPVSENVLHATNMVQSGNQARLTFQAPSEPGEYPYVCTFPGHWMRMYGVMVVVDDLAEFQQNPIAPKDPVGSDRPLVQNWKPADFDNLDQALRGRSIEIGKKIFEEATCATCHLVSGAGKQVGPELTDVWKRWEGDAAGILREIIEPSHKIDAKYVVRKIVTLDGEIVSGIVLNENQKSIFILPNPESPESVEVAKDDIDQMVNSSVSLMPKGLMDRFTKDEIMELLAYLRDVQPTR